MQQIRSYTHTRQHLAAFTRTWKQRTSRRPGTSGGCTPSAGCCRAPRTLPTSRFLRSRSSAKASTSTCRRTESQIQSRPRKTRIRACTKCAVSPCYVLAAHTLRWDIPWLHSRGKPMTNQPEIRFSRRADRTGVRDLAGLPALPAASSTQAAPATAGGAKSLAVKAASRVSRLSNSVVCSGSYFSYPNRSAAERTAIRNRVVNTINSTWGKYIGQSGEVRRGQIFMTTWSFNDWGVRDALVNAAKRGTTVRIIAASGDQRPGALQALERPCGRDQQDDSRMGKASTPTNTSRRQCCGRVPRRRRARHHSKYFLFDDVGNSPSAQHHHADLDEPDPFAFKGQWNQATVWKSAAIFEHFQDDLRPVAERQVTAAATPTCARPSEASPTSSSRGAARRATR